MTETLRDVKKEIRILGFDACNPKIMIGAIVRGGLYLDGVLAFPGKIRAAELAQQISETKYFPELRVMMIHDPRRRLNPRVIRRITAMPVIQVPGQTRFRNGEGSDDEPSKDWESIALHPSALRKILALTLLRGSLPEPVRIAHLLAKLHMFGPLSRDKR